MSRLNLIVEGKTEQLFASSLLVPHLAAKGVYLSKAELVVHARRKGVEHHGGVLSFAPFRGHVDRRLKEDQGADVFFSTMIDLHALPNDFPGIEAARSESDPYRRVKCLELALAEDIDDRRFIPYIQLHEFEALLLADAGKITTYYENCEKEAKALSDIAGDRPELIDDGENTAPSKRIIARIPEYESAKSTAGPVIAAAIGLTTIRNKCPHFDAWLRKLETLGQTPQ